MIEINLRPGQKRAHGASLADLRSRLSSSRDQREEPLPMAAAAVVAAVVLFLELVVAQRRPPVEQPRAAPGAGPPGNQRFKNFVAQKRKVELIRDSVWRRSK
jgi:hypothetical protein